MALYVEVMDLWSNVSYVGPFDDESSAADFITTQPTRFEYHVLTQHEMDSANAEYGPAECFNPDLFK